MQCIRLSTLSILSLPSDWTISVSRPFAEMHPERQCSTGLWYTTVSQDISPPMPHCMDIGMYITQHAWIHSYTPVEQTNSWTVVLRGLVASVLGYSDASQFALYLKAPFPRRTGSNPPKSHFWAKFCIIHMTATIAPLWDMYIYPVIPLHITAQWSSVAQSTFPSMVYWRKLLDRVPFQPTF